MEKKPKKENAVWLREFEKRHSAHEFLLDSFIDLCTELPVVNNESKNLVNPIKEIWSQKNKIYQFKIKSRSRLDL